jgi:hypothetical protein
VGPEASSSKSATSVKPSRLTAPPGSQQEDLADSRQDLRPRILSTKGEGWVLGICTVRIDGPSDRALAARGSFRNWTKCVNWLTFLTPMRVGKRLQPHEAQPAGSFCRR